MRYLYGLLMSFMMLFLYPTMLLANEYDTPIDDYEEVVDQDFGEIESESDPYPNPPTSYNCQMKVIIILDRNFRYEKDARNHCNWVHGLFGKGCSTRSLGYGRGWGSFFRQEFFFKGSGENWGASRSGAFSEYRRWSEKFGWGRGIQHSVFFDRCGARH